MAYRPGPVPITITLLVGLLGIWILSGVMTRAPERPPERTEPAPMRVSVQIFEAEPVAQRLSLQGSVQPGLRVVVRAETAGQVEALPVERGRQVEEGQVIARLAMADREARLRRAEAALEEARSEQRRTGELAERDLAPQQEVDVARARFSAAQAELEAIRLEIDRTRITAPVEGILNRRLVERGEWVAVGGEVAELVQNDPLKAVVQVPQHAIALVREGARGEVQLVNGDTHEGRVSFISAVADPATRTFLVELTLANPDHTIPSGISAQVELPAALLMAHRLSPALLVLSAAGEVGAMVVDEDDVARFHPVAIVRSEPDGLWVTGLPEQVRVITVGQGFVSPGEPVVPVEQALPSAGPTG